MKSNIATMIVPLFFSLISNAQTGSLGAPSSRGDLERANNRLQSTINLLTTVQGINSGNVNPCEYDSKVRSYFIYSFEAEIRRAPGLPENQSIAEAIIKVKSCK